MTKITRIRDRRIDQAGERRKLKPRPKDPYKRRLGKGRWIGYLKGLKGSENWCACWVDAEGVERQETVGSLAEMDYERAIKEVEAVHQRVDKGIGRSGTVWEICEAYIGHLRDACDPTDRRAVFSTQQSERILTRNVKNVALGSRRVTELKPFDLTEWRKGLSKPRVIERTYPKNKDGETSVTQRTVTRSPTSVNRIIRTVKAALNYGSKQGLTDNDRAWKHLTGFKNAENQRDVFLTSEQRMRLLNACPPDLKNYLTALLFTAARPTDIATLRVKDLDLKSGKLRMYHHKVDKQSFLPLTNAAMLEFFKGMARDKLPNAYLITKSDGSSWDAKNQHQMLSNALRKIVQKVRKLKNTKGLSPAEISAAQDALLPLKTVCYTMRHTTISEWLSAGMNISDVGILAGTSIGMIEKHYRKFIQSRSIEEKFASVQVI